MTADHGYGRAGRIAVLVPQENPTAEPELSVLLAPDVATMVMRMISSSPSMATGLCDYGAGLHQWMRGFGDAQFDAVLFACTGTSYLEPPETALPAVWTGPSGWSAPVLTAAAAVRAALDSLGARRLALVSPYPSALQEAAVAYWSQRGFDVLALESLAAPKSGHMIYQQTDAAMAGAVARAKDAQADAILILGTGAPTLAVIGGPSPDTPILSSALCLGWAAGLALTPQNQIPFSVWLSQTALWRSRLRQRFPRAATANLGH